MLSDRDLDDIKTKRSSDPKKWTFKVLAALYGLSPSYLFKILKDQTNQDRTIRLPGHKVKFTDGQVRAIRSDTRSLKDIAEDYGVTPSNIAHIRTRRTYKCIF